MSLGQLRSHFQNDGDDDDVVDGRGNNDDEDEIFDVVNEGLTWLLAAFNPKVSHGSGQSNEIDFWQAIAND